MQKLNKGHSLVETMIYMILGVIVIGYALSSMTHISKGYVKSRTVMKMQKDGRDAVQVMAREIANTGYKFYIKDTTVDIIDDFSTPPDGTKDAAKAITFYTTRPQRNPKIINKDQFDNSSTINYTLVPDTDINWLRASYTGAISTSTASGTSGGPNACFENERSGAGPDSAASFYFWPADKALSNSDTLEIYKARPSGTGLSSIHRVKYFIRNDSLFREEQVANGAGNTGLNGDYRDATTGDLIVATASVAIWPSSGANFNFTSTAILTDVYALQFQFSENGRDWVDDPSGKRQLMKQIKIQLLVKSDKTFKEKYDIAYKLGDLDEIHTDTISTNELYRLYEKIVEIPNNGIISAN